MLNAPQLAVPTVERAADVAEAQVHDDGPRSLRRSRTTSLSSVQLLWRWVVATLRSLSPEDSRYSHAIDAGHRWQTLFSCLGITP